MKKISLKPLPFLIWSFLFTIIPFFVLIFFSLTNSNNCLNFNNYFKILSHGKIFLKSLTLALIVTSLCLILSYPVAYSISLIKKKLTQQLLISAITLSMWTNLLLKTYAWMSIFEKNGFLNKILIFLKLKPLKLINTPFIIVFVLIFENIPFMILPIHSTLSEINPQILTASKDLGATSFQTFKQIIFPLSLSGVIMGTSVVFVSSISSFVAPSLLGGGSNILIGNLIEMQFMGSIYNPWFGSALAIALILIIAFIVSQLLRKQ